MLEIITSEYDVTKRLGNGRPIVPPVESTYALLLNEHKNNYSVSCQIIQVFFSDQVILIVKRSFVKNHGI